MEYLPNWVSVPLMRLFGKALRRSKQKQYGVRHEWMHASVFMVISDILECAVTG